MEAVIRPWGCYIVLEKSEHCLKKLLCFKNGLGIRKQKHEHRSEAWKVLQGTGKLLLDTEWSEIHKDDLVIIPEDTVHKVIGNDYLIIYEVQQGDIISEDDIIIVD